MSKRKRRHPQPPLGARGPSLEKILERAGVLFEAGRTKEALEVLEEVPPHYQRVPEVLLFKGVILSAMDELQEALPLLEEAYQRAPDNPIIAFALGRVYDLLDMSAHTLRTLRPFVQQLEMIPEPDLAEATRAAIASAEEEVQYWIGILGIPREKIEEGMYQVERALRFAEAGEFPQALQALRSASQLAPDWLLPRDLEMEFLFMAGNLPEAIRRAEQLSARYPDDPFFVLKLARYSIANGDRKRAEAIVQPLRSRRFPNAQVLEEAIQVFGLLEDDQALYDLYRKHKKMLQDIPSDLPLIALGSAAANLGDFRTAQNLWDKVAKGGFPYSQLAYLFRAAQRRAPGPGLSTRYPTHFPAWVLPSPVVSEYIELVNRWNEGEIEEKQIRKRLRSLLDRSPLVLDFIIQELREMQYPMLMAKILSLIGTPEALEEVRRFVFSQEGEFAKRISAAQLLVEAGALDPLVELWEEERQEWRPFIVPPRDWEGIYALQPSPQVQPLIEQMMQAIGRGQQEEALEAIQKAIALEPDEPAHYQTLGGVYQAMGDKESAQKCFQKAIEMDPLLIFARTSIALSAMQKGDLADARRHLEAVARRRPFTLPDLTVYLHTLGLLGLMEGDLAYARFCAESGLELGIGDEMFRNLLRDIAYAEEAPYLEMYRQQTRRREEKKRRQPISADASLSECLGRLTKEALSGLARELRISYNVRKALLIQQIAEVLTDSEHLKHALGNSPTRRSRPFGTSWRQAIFFPGMSLLPAMTTTWTRTRTGSIGGPKR